MTESVQIGERDVVIHFVGCSTTNGRPKQVRYHFANRHTASDRSANKGHERHDRALDITMPPDIILYDDPDPHPDSTLLTDGTGCAYGSDLFGLSEVLRWYQYNQADTSTYIYHAARHHWFELCWDWIRVSKPFYYCMAMYAMIKKTKITGETSARRYLEFKVRALQQIQAELVTGKTNRQRSMTLLATGQMSFCELQDANILISAYHLRILSNISAACSMTRYEWLYLS